MAKAATRLKTAAVSFPIPQTAEDAATFIARLGAAQRERSLIETAMNEQMAAVKEQFEAQAKPFNDQIEQLTRGLQTFCEANRAKLTDNNKVKFHRFGTGEVNWRQRPPKVTVRGIDTVIENLKRLDLTRFIRIKEDVNRDAMLAEPDVAKTVAGVSIGSAGEDFIVRPFETQLDAVAL